MTQFGLVCMTSDQAPSDVRVKYRAMTRKSLQKLTIAAARLHLSALYRDNVLALFKGIQFCHDRGIGHFRMSSSMFPFADLAMYADLLPLEDLAAAGAMAQRLGIRLGSHPDHFVVLSSQTPSVIQNSITALTLEARFFDALGLPQSHYAPINVHVGSSWAGAGDTIVSVIADLPDGIRRRLTLENDDKGRFGSAATLEVCLVSGVAMCFDYHHEAVFSKLETYADPSLEHYRAAAAETWTDTAWQVCHLSNGIDGITDRRHSSYISEMPLYWEQCPVLEIEADAKELAIAALPI